MTMKEFESSPGNLSKHYREMYDEEMADRAIEMKTVPPIGTRVRYESENISGTIVGRNWRAVRIEWDDGEFSLVDIRAECFPKWLADAKKHEDRNSKEFKEG
jgi:hypothetical protein